VFHPAAPTQAEVETKYRAVRREYDDFRQAYGERLSPSWHRILEQNTFGQGPDRYQRVNALLDELRREMNRVRQNGG
jgi:hypothetical protein